MSVTENMLEFVPNSKCSEIVQQYVIGLRGTQSREMGVRDEVMLCLSQRYGLCNYYKEVYSYKLVLDVLSSFSQHHGKCSTSTKRRMQASAKNIG